MVLCVSKLDSGFGFYSSRASPGPRGPFWAMRTGVTIPNDESSAQFQFQSEVFIMIQGLRFQPSSEHISCCPPPRRCGSCTRWPTGPPPASSVST